MSTQSGGNLWLALNWIARIGGFAAIVPIMLIAWGEPGTGPHDIRECLYLALFPCGFSAGYLAAWRWPLAAGCFSLLSLAASHLVIGRTFPPGAYVVWLVLCLPALLFILAGWKLRGPNAPAESIRY